MKHHLSHDLHVLTARLDRAADQLLRAEYNITYARFLALFFVGIGASSQRDLARWLGVTEPSVSRMTGVLVKAGWLNVAADPAGGNRRQLGLSETGQKLVRACGELLEQRFAAFVKASGIPYPEYAQYTHQLLDQLDGVSHQQQLETLMGAPPS